MQSLSRRFEQPRASIVGLVEDSHTIGQRQSAIKTEKSIQKFARRTWALIEAVFGPSGIATKVKAKPSLSIGQVPSRHEEQVKTYAEQTMVDTLAKTDRERDKSPSLGITIRTACRRNGPILWRNLIPEAVDEHLNESSGDVGTRSLCK